MANLPSPSVLTYRLPDHWTAPEIVEDVIVANGLRLHRAGLSTTATTDGHEVLGSAADVSGPTIRRAWFELLERVSGLEAIRSTRSTFDLFNENGERIGAPRDHAILFPDSPSKEWRHAQSNGIALHSNWRSACERALWELAERDRVLRSWHGAIRPLSEDIVVTPEGAYEWRVSSFPDHAGGFSSDLHVVGAFGFPKQAGDPFVLGFAGRPQKADAIAAATMEARQLLAFLWGEPLPDTISDAPGPMQHLDAYQISGAQEKVHAWLDGAHVSFGSGDAFDTGDETDTDAVVRFVDLTPPWISENLRVAKAVCSRAMPLTFGRSPFVEHLPRELQLHPLP
jgi:hypothetical protein